ncbi:MAG: HD domain-containing protein [Planctomycetes bacterium]|nr:HD domain-containing protein [Planctomycetota bacterium]MCB9887577.1 HD domain-containing protein [Planctomycetota bacterium]
MVSSPASTADTYTAIPLAGLVAREPAPFPLYLRTAEDVWVLYRPAEGPLDESHLGRLQAEGIAQLFIRDVDRRAYFGRVERSLDGILRERGVALEQRAEVLQGVALSVATELLAAPPDRDTVQRANKVMLAACGLMNRDKDALRAIRRVLGASDGLAEHSLTVGFLCMALAKVVMSADSTVMVQAGLAGLLHDVGRVGHENLEHDPEHAERGAELLRRLALPKAVVDAALSHHERFDGSGYPHGLRGSHIPEMARLVGLVNTFDKIYSTQQPRVGVFDALRILAQAYRGCFEERMTVAFLQLFR